jgi:hypothetical protein
LISRKGAKAQRKNGKKQQLNHAAQRIGRNINRLFYPLRLGAFARGFFSIYIRQPGLTSGF